VDDHLVAFVADEHDDLKEVGGSVRTDDKPPVGVLTDVIDRHGVFDGVEDVFIGDAVTAGSGMDLHTPIL
jgi:hypothetical protein